jgi:hypothetical protein
VTQDKSNPEFVICVDNGGYPVSLEVRGVYRCKVDTRAAENGLLRVVDETGEDYLYRKEMFEPAPKPATTRRR